MKKWMSGNLAAACMVCCICLTATAQLPEVTEEASEALGSAFGAPQMTGFVFIDGKYIAPPYTVMRKGNGIYINRIPVELPVMWPRGGTAAGAVTVPKKTIDDDGDFEIVPAGQTQATPEPAKTVKSIDDLFADEDEPEVAATPDETAAPAVAAARPATTQSPEEIERDKELAVEALERIRKGYEQALGNGEIFFFGHRHHRVNGTYGSARTLMGVLPRALRQAVSAQDLQQRLQQGGIYFLDMVICAELFKNKMTFPQLETRLRRIEENEAAEAQKRKASRSW